MQNRDPYPNAVQSANWTCVGLCAHQSALKGGEIVRLSKEHADLVEIVRSHAIGDWRAAAFLLERKHKKDWGRHETIEATVTQQLDEDLDL